MTPAPAPSVAMPSNSHTRAITARLERLGRQATLYSRSGSGTNEFNNTAWTFDADPTNTGTDQTVLCVRTYDNRNTEVQQNAGDRNRDTPVLLFPASEYAKVNDSDRIGYPEADGTETQYELQAPTHHPTHVEIFAEVVTN